MVLNLVYCDVFLLTFLLLHRRPSLVRHPSFENVVASLESQKSSKASSKPDLCKLNGASNATAIQTPLDQEKQLQDDYIAFKFGLHR